MSLINQDRNEISNTVLNATGIKLAVMVGNIC